MGDFPIWFFMMPIIIRYINSLLIRELFIFHAKFVNGLFDRGLELLSRLIGAHLLINQLKSVDVFRFN